MQVWWGFGFRVRAQVVGSLTAGTSRAGLGFRVSEIWVPMLRSKLAAFAQGRL